MPRTRETINTYLYPLLILASVIYFAVQIAPITKQARFKNKCYQGVEATLKTKTPNDALSLAVAFCNGSEINKKSDKKVRIRLRRNAQKTQQPELPALQ